jgi:hypothetical protein
METDTTLPVGEYDDEDVWEEWVSYSTKMHKALASMVKKFLVDFFGKRMYSLEPDTYRQIDKIIRDGFISGDIIPDYLHIHRTIKDEDLWEEARNKFEIENVKFGWQKMPQWYDREFVNDDEKYLEGIPESELTQEQKEAKKLYECANKILNMHAGFSSFIKKGCDLLIPALQKYIENTASFDLSILSYEGYEHIQASLDNIASDIFNNLYLEILE